MVAGLLGFSVVAAAYGSPGALTSGLDIRNIHVTYSGDPRHEATVSWRTGGDRVVPKVQFWSETEAQGECAGVSIVHAGGWQNHVRVKGLKPGTDYRYRVSGPAGEWGPLCRFRTAPGGDEAFTFAVVGDVQGKAEPSAAWQQANDYLATRTDIAFAVLTGDLVDTGGDQRQWDAFFHPGGDGAPGAMFHRMAVMPVPGNHDYYGRAADGSRTEDGLSHYLTQFRLPANGRFGEWDGRFYSFVYGNARFVMLDSEGAAESRTRMMREQTDWLAGLPFDENVSALAFLHRPVYPFLRHAPSFEARGIWRPNFFDRHFKLVFNGHNHAHAVSKPLRAVRLDGLAGGRGFNGPWQAGQENGLARTLLLEEGDVIDYAGVPSSGRAVFTGTQGSFNTAPVHIRRQIVPIDPQTHRTIWMGYLYEKKGGWYAADQGGWQLASAADSTRALQVNATRTEDPTGGSGRFRLAIGKNAAVSKRLIAREGRDTIPQAPFFVLAKFVFSHTGTKAFLRHYQSPEPLPEGEPDEWDAEVVSSEVYSAAFDQLTLMGESPRRESLVDEIRVGPSACSVIPPSEAKPMPRPAWVEDRFDAVDAVSDEGVVYYDAGGVNFSCEPDDLWYVQHRQENGMRLLGIVQVTAAAIRVETVFFNAFGARRAGDVLHTVERRR